MKAFFSEKMKPFLFIAATQRLVPMDQEQEIGDCMAMATASITLCSRVNDIALTKERRQLSDPVLMTG